MPRQGRDTAENENKADECLISNFIFEPNIGNSYAESGLSGRTMQGVRALCSILPEEKYHHQ